MNGPDQHERLGPQDRRNSVTNKSAYVNSDARKRRVLIVDLNNFATFPTLTVGVLVQLSVRKGHEVQVLCPLAHDVPAAERERQENWFDHFKQRIHLTEELRGCEFRDTFPDGTGRGGVERPQSHCV